MSTRVRNQNRYRARGDYHRSYGFGSCEIKRDLRERARSGVPPHIDRVIIVVGGCADRTRRTARTLMRHMPVNRRWRDGMISIVGVDVCEWRLAEAQQQGDRTQKCARRLHDYIGITLSNRVGFWLPNSALGDHVHNGRALWEDEAKAFAEMVGRTVRAWKRTSITPRGSKCWLQHGSCRMAVNADPP